MFGVFLVIILKRKRLRAIKIFPILERILPRLSGGIAYLNPSCGLEYLPREKAVAKLKLMKELRDTFLHRGRR